jgi:hypothetical protein
MLQLYFKILSFILSVCFYFKPLCLTLSQYLLFLIRGWKNFPGPSLQYIRDSSVDIATCYWLDGQESNPGGGEIFRTHPDQPWGPSSLLYNGYRVSFAGVKRPRRGVSHPSPSSAEVEERVELYLFSPSEPSWPVLWWTLFLASTYIRSPTPYLIFVSTQVLAEKYYFNPFKFSNSCMYQLFEYLTHSTLYFVFRILLQ